MQLKKVTSENVVKSIFPMLKKDRSIHIKVKLNPFNPMDSNTRGLFQKVDSIEYWKARGRDAMKGVQ